MIRWAESDPERLHPQEQALLALCDRLRMLEQVLAVEMDHTRAQRRRIDRLEVELASFRAIPERNE